jgi:four helix bundle protein
MRRAAASVPTNIAEGSKRRSNKEYATFLNRAEASVAEVEYLLMLVRDLGFVTAASSAPLLGEVDEIARMLHHLRVRVEDAQGATSQATPPGAEGF